MAAIVGGMSEQKQQRVLRHGPHIVVGTPGRILRFRFPEAIIAALQRIAWWDWPHAALRDGLADFRQMDAAAFCRKYDPGCA